MTIMLREAVLNFYRWGEEFLHILLMLKNYVQAVLFPCYFFSYKCI
jgi:hypothetical protein